MPGLYQAPPGTTVRVTLAGLPPIPLGTTTVDGAVVQGEVTYFARCTPLPGVEDEFSSCVVNLGMFATFVAWVVFDSEEARLTLLAMESDQGA